MERQEILRNCADFKEIYDCVFNKYGAEEYMEVLDKIEDELEWYENATEDEIEVKVQANTLPDSVQWYVGMIDTEYFINECWL